MDGKTNNHYPKPIVVVTMIQVVVAVEQGRMVRIVVPRTAPHDVPELPDLWEDHK